MKISFGLFNRPALYFILRYATETRPAVGFVVKLRRDKLPSERWGKRRGFNVGPLYFRTYA